jgi:EpsI family protein
VSRPGPVWMRFFVTLALLAATAVFLEARRQVEPTLPRKPLAEFPETVGEWKGIDLKLTPEVLQVLGPGDFLTRIYQRPALGPHLDLFIAYFPSQRTGDTIHSPQNCLPGAGWSPLERSRMELAGPGGRRIEVNFFVIGKGLDKQVVLYWYQAHGRVVASEYSAKYYLVADAIRSNRSDGALVRVITSIASNEEKVGAVQRAARFAEQILPLLDDHIPN